MNKTLLQTIKSLIETARASVVRQVDSTMTLTYFLIGRYIVEDEQQGEQRAGYAAETLKYLSAELTKEFEWSYLEDNLGNLRRFYVAYCHRMVSTKEASISEKLSRKLESAAENPFGFPVRIMCYLNSCAGGGTELLPYKLCRTTRAMITCNIILMIPSKAHL